MALGTTPAPWISIVIPCKGHAEELRACLQGLQQQHDGIPFETIVVDSAWDPRVEATARQFKSVTLIRSHADLSAGAARNQGAQHAAASVLGFIDADCIPQPGWIQAARDAIEDGALMASGPILDAMPWNWLASTDNRLQFVDFPPRRPAGPSPYFPGAHLVVPRHAFEAIAGFDPDLHVAQDVLFTQEVARRWPGQALFRPRMIVRHFGRASWGALWEHQWQFGRARAIFNIRMGGPLAWLARHPILAWIVGLRRWLYISARVVQWNFRDLPRYIWQTPVILFGLIAWTQGFYAGQRELSSRRP